MITDGAWGTQLQAVGLEPGQCPEEWNMIHEHKVHQVALDYVEAGSQIILTNTFGANRILLRRHGLEDALIEINRQGAEISRSAAEGRALVFSSIGPSGKILMTGDVSVFDLECLYAEQVEALAEGGVDGFVIETMAELAEAEIALRMAKKIGKPVVVCMVYDSGRDKDRTMMGTTPEEAAAVLTDAGADIIGANCGNGIEGFANICRRLRQNTALPLWMKPNAGFPEMRANQLAYAMTPAQFAQHAILLAEAGADFIGGCCGTSPEFIQAISAQFAPHES